jgi:hypothetical protein
MNREWRIRSDVDGGACATRDECAADAALHAKAQLTRMIYLQAAFLGFLDCFWLLSCACMIGASLVFFTRKFRSAGPAVGH